MFDLGWAGPRYVWIGWVLGWVGMGLHIFKLVEGRDI